MDHPDRMSLGNGFTGLKQVPDGFNRWERSRHSKSGAQVLSLEVLEHDVGRSVIELPDVDDACHVLVFELNRRLSFAKEPSDVVLIMGCVRQQELDCEDLPKREVSRSDDHADAARPEHTLDLVLSGDGLTGLGGD
ncbi:MAG: hypothetical protein QM784_34655 [Polyangiaceae bacterium]